jgi:hypothetical protein
MPPWRPRLLGFVENFDTKIIEFGNGFADPTVCQIRDVV